jgi:hypothetical protein
MAAGDLTSLSNVKAWLSVSSSGDDALLGRLVTSASRSILNYIGRPNLLVHSVNEVRNGTGTERMMMREFPVLAVSSVSVNGSVIPAQPVNQPLAGGYIFDPWDGQDASGPQRLQLIGYSFYCGSGNVTLQYTAGFQSVEDDVVPVGATPSIVVARPWAGDVSVTYATGAALTPVASAPAVGQYAVSAGTYAFNTGDGGQSIIISYSYIPEDLEQVCNEVVGEAYRRKDRIGQASKSLGGQETISFIQTKLNATAQAMLDPYRLVAPIGR